MRMWKTAGIALPFALLCLAGLPVHAQVEAEGSFRDTVEALYGEPGEFMVNSNADVEVVHFESPRTIRVCLKKAEHTVPLQIEYADSEKVLKPGNCTVVEAEEIAFSSGGDLQEGWNLSGEFEDMSHDKS